MTSMQAFLRNDEVHAQELTPQPELKIVKSDKEAQAPSNEEKIKEEKPDPCTYQERMCGKSYTQQQLVKFLRNTM